MTLSTTMHRLASGFAGLWGPRSYSRPFRIGERRYAARILWK